MKASYDEIITTALKRQHEPQQIIGDLLTAEIRESEPANATGPRERVCEANACTRCNGDLPEARQKEQRKHFPSTATRVVRPIISGNTRTS